MKLTLEQAATWMGASGSYAHDTLATGYSIDSRTVQAGDLFFAVTGERLDGHEYVAAALGRGAVAAVVLAHWTAPEGVSEAVLLRVKGDVLAAMQRLATAVRMHWGKRVIGVTGSAGKTTTKEFVAQVLGAQWKVLKSAGNLNNNFGVPLQLLRIEPEHDVAVIEMGMNHAGEIAFLAKMAEPNWAVVSNVAPVHLEFFPEGICGIARAKYELIEALPPDGVAVLNGDDQYVRQFGRGMDARAVYYGLSETADVRAEAVEELGAEGMRFIVVAGEARETVHLKLMGRHNVWNALAGIAVGLKSGMTLTACARAAETMQPTEKRGQVVEWHGAQIVNDCYNSNPRALDAMVDALLAMKAERHIVVAGEMLELGPKAAELHAACGERMAQRGVKIVLGVRGMARHLVDAAKAQGAEAIYMETPAEAGAWLREHLQAGDAVLLKASRGVRLEESLKELEG
ncbi:MAG TPA: UDP-N-acetylmuramoyl-tripeptide--D-alanyl-D-alanine ligase [Acidobacteriaceae bacterium]